jgi:hypothetical protein
VTKPKAPSTFAFVVSLSVKAGAKVSPAAARQHLRSQVTLGSPHVLGATIRKVTVIPIREG